jgi:hypothetical protein
MADFPSYAPSSRSFSPGLYPQKSYKSLSGYVVKRTFGDRPSSAKLDLEFSNITDDKVVGILNHYRSQTARNARFKVSSKVLTGLSGDLAQIAGGALDDLRWEYEAPPQVQSIRNGVSSVRVSLLGEIRNTFTDEA